MGRRMVQVDHDSQKLIEASYRGDTSVVVDCLNNPLVDVNYTGTVSLRVKCAEIILHEEAPDEVSIAYDEFRTDVTALFIAAHAGHVELVRRLLTAGADVNQKLFRGYAITAAAREGHQEIVGMLVKAAASQPACEEALIESCLYGQAKSAELLIKSEMVRPSVAVHALVQACCRGFVDIVSTLIDNGVDANSWDRPLLRSAKPALYANVDCTPLIAAIISRQISTVNLLLKSGVNTDCKVSLGAWSWDSYLGKELRVGAGLADSYNEAWCAVEYYEATGTILRLLLKHLSPNSEHQGRTLVFHAILCQNLEALKVLLSCGADSEFRAKTRNGQEFCPIHMAARMGNLQILRQLIEHGCNLNSTTEGGDTSLILCLRANHQDCFKALVNSGADFAKVNTEGQSLLSIAEAIKRVAFLYEVVCEIINSGKAIYSSNLQIFSPLHFICKFGNSKVLQKLLQQSVCNLNLLDENGFSALMVTAREGHVDAFKSLVFAGADLSLKNKKGETAVRLALGHANKDAFEKVLLNAVLTFDLKCEDFRPLHYAARKGDIEAIRDLLSKGYAINTLDEDGYTPLMLAAKEGNGDACKVLIHGGADCGIVNQRGETALSLSRTKSSRIAEGVILDHLARKLVLAGDQLCKHTKQGKGNPHMKIVRMHKSGMFSWGKSTKRNVYIKEAILGPSPTFRRNRGRNSGNFQATFRIITARRKEFHFEARSVANADVWVRGINLIVKEATLSSVSGIRR